MVTSFDYEQARTSPLLRDREYSEEEMWEYLEDWIRIITPIAEEEGIRLGIHPCEDGLIQESMGEIYEEFVKLKEAEWRDYHRQVTRWEIDRYLTLF